MDKIIKQIINGMRIRTWVLITKLENGVLMQAYIKQDGNIDKVDGQVNERRG